MSKYDDCHRVDNRYTTAIGMSVWRFFNIGKYKNQKVKDVCYFNPFYVAWCLENWQGFSLTGYATKHPYALVGLHKQVISNSADITWICNLYPWNQVEPDMIEAEEEVMLDILADNNMLIDRKS